MPAKAGILLIKLLFISVHFVLIKREPKNYDQN